MADVVYLTPEFVEDLASFYALDASWFEREYHSRTGKQLSVIVMGFHCDIGECNHGNHDGTIDIHIKPNKKLPFMKFTCEFLPASGMKPNPKVTRWIPTR